MYENKAQENFPMEFATKIMSELLQLNHREQVQVFDNLRKLILEDRKEKAACYEKENEARCADLKEHIDSSNHIAAAL